MKTLKSIDGKSLLIGGLLTAVMFLGLGATSITDKWSQAQKWETGRIIVLNKGFDLLPDKDRLAKDFADRYTHHTEWPAGWEPINRYTDGTALGWTARRRIK